MFFRILIALIAVAAIYVTYEIIATHLYYKGLHTPQAPFMAMNNETGDIPVIQFMDLNCAECKKANLLLMDFAKENPDILYILRPIFRNETVRISEAQTLFAAGAQEKYWDLLRLIDQYDGDINEQFLKDNAALIELDFERLKKDYDSKETVKILQENALVLARTELKSTQALMVGKKLYYLEGPLTKDDITEMVTNERQSR